MYQIHRRNEDFFLSVEKMQIIIKLIHVTGSSREPTSFRCNYSAHFHAISQSIWTIYSTRQRDEIHYHSFLQFLRNEFRISSSLNGIIATSHCQIRMQIFRCYSGSPPDDAMIWPRLFGWWAIQPAIQRLGRASPTKLFMNYLRIQCNGNLG